MTMRVGTGFDQHALSAGGPLLLGGVVVPFERGLLGHSDADALLHAIVDALLVTLPADLVTKGARAGRRQDVLPPV